MNRYASLLGLAGCLTSVVEPAEQPIVEDPPVPVVPGFEAGEPAIPCDLESLVPPQDQVRRVKNLLTGLAVRDDELAAVSEDPTALRELVADWAQTPAFERKMAGFFRKTMQLDDVTDLARQITNSDSNNRMLPALEDNLRESFVRTALRIVAEDRPFTDVVETRRWQMTTGMLAWLRALDGEPEEVEQMRFYVAPYASDGVTFDEQTPLSEQIAAHTFFAPGLDLACADDPYVVPYRGTRRYIETLSTIFGHSPSGDACEVSLGLFGPEDFADWRDVTLVSAEDEPPVAFYDAPELRGRTTLPLSTPRAGFFSHPAFLASWDTNVDNSHRVTINQALIVALGLQFESSDSTTPLGDEGLSSDHASPETACYGCHKNLDPMRNYFKNAFAEPYYAAPDPDDEDEDSQWERASFAFQGFTGDASAPDETLVDLGRHLAAHPHFATGWVQKLCYFANSEPCDDSDPELARVVEAFEGSNFSFRTLLVELFSSPLVTRGACADDHARQIGEASIARRGHFCAAMAERLGVDEVCTTGRSRADDLAQTVPDDAWSRGREAPELVSSPSLFYTSTLDALCQAIANNVVNRDETPLTTSDLDGSVRFLVTDVMGLPPSDPRHGPVLERLQGVVEAADEVGAGSAEQLRTAFVVACNSPFVATLDL